jgi:hypothetical protein
MRTFATLLLALALVRDVLAGGDDASADSFSHMIEKVRLASCAPDRSVGATTSLTARSII